MQAPDGTSAPPEDDQASPPSTVSPPSRLPALPLRHPQHRLPPQRYQPRRRGFNQSLNAAVPSVSEWQQYSSLKLKLSNLPPTLTTWDIHESFLRKVDVGFIEILENRQGERNGMAIVRIEPPPKINYWASGFWSIPRDNAPTVRAGVEIDRFGFRGFDERTLTPVSRRISAKPVLDLSSIQFGLLYQPTTMMNMQTLEASTGLNGSRMMIDFKRMRVHLEFSIDWASLGLQAYEFDGSVAYQSHHYRAEIGFSQLKHLVYHEHSTEGSALVIHLNHPALFYRKMNRVDATHSRDRLTWTERDLWHRQINIMEDPRLMRDEVVCLDKSQQFIDVGRWTTYRLCLDSKAAAKWSELERDLQDYNVKTSRPDIFDVIPGKGSDLRQILDGSQHAIKSTSSATALLGQIAHTSLRFDVRYQLEVCLSRGVLLEQALNQDFVQQLASLDADNARMMLEFLSERGARVFNPQEIFSDPNVLTYYPNVTEQSLPEYCALVRKAVVTPTTIYLSTPAVETNNRILREYKDLKDRFLRVQFTDELPEGRVNSMSDAKKNDEVFLRVYRCLNNGIRVGDRHYKLLAWGNSQLRENGAFFFAETDHTSCEDIRKWMGDFSHIKNIAKYAARLGQCFSTTRLIPGFSVPQLVTIEDITRSGFCFTDGVGKISLFWARMISNHLQLDYVPSAFQFRMGGCKGMLVTWPAAKKGEVHIRPSQEKFTGAVFNGLEVIRCSSFSTPTLNRQSITILSCLGVPDDVFHRLLSKQLTGINLAMKSEKEAREQLCRAVDENQITLILANLISKGFMQAREPFVWSLLRLWRSWSVKLIKEKARISVENGAFLLGVVDETGTLRGHSIQAESDQEARQDPSLLPQVFLQVPNPHARGEYRVIKGLCVLGRNPSLHPGDIRVVEAVDVPELRHLRDVVVVPSQGDRDVPGMCSGGDLDGDDYFVFWDEGLIPPKRLWNYPPMNYAAPKAPVVDDQVTMNDLMKFFVMHMKNDSLPRIAHAHLAQADRLDSGAKNAKCKELAALHSMAVDYVKTGIPAQMPKYLSPREWPHFMEKRHKRPYHSERILGQLYDEVQTMNFQPAYDMPFDQRILRRYKLGDEVLKSARRIKSQYDMSMRQLMGQREIKTEFEVWSAFILSKPRFGSDYKQSEDVNRETSALKARFKDLCVKAAGGSKDFDNIAPFVAAMYKITQEEVRIAIHESNRDNISTTGKVFRRKMNAKSMPLISFPWIFHKELGQIATGTKTESAVRSVSGSSVKLAQKSASVEQNAAEDLGLDEVDDMDYIRTADGVVYHRGEVINFFHHDSDIDEDDDDGVASDQGNDKHFDGDDADLEDAVTASSKPDAREGQGKADQCVGESATNGSKDEKTEVPATLLLAALETLPSTTALPLHGSQETIQPRNGAGPAGPRDRGMMQMDGVDDDAGLATEEVSALQMSDDEDSFQIEEEVITIPQEENALERAARLFGD